MPQRYYETDSLLGANFYQAYLDTVAGQPTILGPSQLLELGVKAGTRVAGCLNTTWMFANTGTASPVVNAGTAVAINTATFVVQTGTSTLNGTPLIGMAAGAPGGLWLETSGATLNLAPVMSEAEEAAAAKAAEAATAAAATTATPAPGAHAPGTAHTPGTHAPGTHAHAR